MLPKSVKGLKVIDLISQLFIFILGVYWICVQLDIRQTALSGKYDSVILTEFLLGGWQFISATIHLMFYPKELWYKLRKPHFIVSLLLLTIPSISFLVFGDIQIDNTLIFNAVLVLFFLAPILAIMYLIISIKELKQYTQ